MVENMNELVEAMKNARAEHYNAFGIRSIRKAAGFLNVGDSCPDSYDWNLEFDCSTYDTTGKRLPGASAVGICWTNLWLDGDDDDDVAEEIGKAIEMSDNGYWFNDSEHQMLLIGGCDGSTYGDDPDEVVIENAKVLGIVQIKK